MSLPYQSKISAQLIQKSRSFPGILAGIVRTSDLAASPSCRSREKDIETRNGSMKSPGAGKKPDAANSVLVLAMSHPPTDLHLDWWDGKGTWGNRILISIAEKIKNWFQQNFGIPSTVLPYHIENGGVFLKDAAVMAGIGVIGRNNLLVTPEFGPRVRLKALMLDIDATPSDPLKDFSPCNDCDTPCLRICPQNAFAGGTYSKKDCLIQMHKDKTVTAVVEASGAMQKGAGLVEFCRACEMICPKGYE